MHLIDKKDKIISAHEKIKEIFSDVDDMSYIILTNKPYGVVKVEDHPELILHIYFDEDDAKFEISNHSKSTEIFDSKTIGFDLDSDGEIIVSGIEDIIIDCLEH